jgi:hypothetical protein
MDVSTFGPPVLKAIQTNIGRSLSELNKINPKDSTLTTLIEDYTKINNPIQLYNSSTSWNEPVFKYNEFVDIIAIENLPSLLPYESSNDFSKKCTELLLQYDNEIWNNNLLEFYNAIFFI